MAQLRFFVSGDHQHGLVFRARHDPSRMCAALFDRTAELLSEETMGSRWDNANRRLLGRILDHYEFGLQ